MRDILRSHLQLNEQKRNSGSTHRHVKPHHQLVGWAHYAAAPFRNTTREFSILDKKNW